MIETNKVIEKAIATYGGELQSMVAMEECAELAQAISKCIREPHDEEARKHLVEEMADVMICLEHLKRIYDVSDLELDFWTASKLGRLERRLNHGKN